MCTLIVSFRQHRGFPLVVAANRDERRDRPASGPLVWPDEPFLAPRDEQALGTWLGLTRGGMFVGVTNRFLAPKHPERESRGTLVVEALRAPSATELHAHLKALSPTRFNAFHLLYADAQHAFVTFSDGDVLQQQVLDAGLHIVTERSLGGDDRARQELISERWPTVSPGGALPTLEALQQLLATTRPDDPLGSVCVDLPDYDYGTRSAFVLQRADALRDSRLAFADGPPDRTPFIERPELLAKLIA